MLFLSKKKRTYILKKFDHSDSFFLAILTKYICNYIHISIDILDKHLLKKFYYLSASNMSKE